MTSAAVAKALDDRLEQLLHSDAPLADRLAQYASVLRDINRPFAEAVDRLVEGLMAVGAGGAAPNIGDVLPPFLLPDGQGHLVSLAGLLARGPLVVAFRRGHWCPYCQISTAALARVHQEAGARGAHVVAISPELEPFTNLLKDKTASAFPILSDVDNGYAMSLGLAISVGKEMQDFMSRRGRRLALYQGNDAWLLPIPATFVLDRAGVVVMRHVDADYRRRAAIEDILAAIATVTR